MYSMPNKIGIKPNVNVYRATFLISYVCAETLQFVGMVSYYSTVPFLGGLDRWNLATYIESLQVFLI